MKGKKKMLAAVLAGALTAAAALTALGAGLGGRETAVEVFEDASFDALSCRVLLEADLGSEYRTIGEKHGIADDARSTVLCPCISSRPK